MNSRKFKKAIKRLSNLPTGKYFFMYSWNKVKHFYYKIIKSTKIAYPSTVMIELSAHCNLHCTTCPREYAYGKEMDKGYMAVDNAKKIIDELWPYLDSVGLTGMGETFLYKEIEEIVDYIKSKNKGIIISISTNAVIPNFIETVTPLVGKIDTIQISIDGLNEIYDSIRLNASFSILDNNLRTLRKLFPKSETTFMLNMVVTKENYHQMADLISYAEKIGIQYMNFTLFNLASVTNVPANYYDMYQETKFIDELKKVEKKKSQTKNVIVTNWDYNSKNEFKKCNLPWSHFAICWNGEIPPCCAKPFPKELSFGNVLEQGVMPVLNSHKFRAFRIMWFANKTPEFCDKCHFIDIKPIPVNN
ncbi:MAG: radical SAM protein [Candidatus Azobacteroides sp.]|nr:radical SAM protein [Candidatus Azobacteroides sp.]